MIKNTFVKAIALVLTAALLLAGCGSPAPASSQSVSSAPSESTASSQSAAPTESQPDQAVPEKIVSLAPSNTQILLALGLGDKLVAVDKYSAKLEGVPQGLPLFDIMTPDAELLVALEADIILTTGMSSAKGEDPFVTVRDAGVRVHNTNTAKTIQEIRDSVVDIGAQVGRADEAAALLVEMDKTIEAVAAIGSTITDKKRVYFEIAAAPSAYSFGSGVYLNEMLELLGAENILADQENWLSVSEEAVLAADPQVILTNVDYLDDPAGEIKARAGWNVITAVKENQVYVLPKNPTSLPNHTMAEGLVLMAKAIYPVEYKDLA